MAFDSRREFEGDKVLVARVADLMGSRELRIAIQVAWNTFTQAVRGDESAAKIAGAREFLAVLEELSLSERKSGHRADQNLSTQ